MGSASKRLRLQDVADAAGVSTGTVSLVLAGRPGPSPAMAQRVVEVANRLGYRPNRTASRLASNRTRLLGVTITPANLYHAHMVEEIEAEAAAAGYDVLLSAMTRVRGEQRAIETLVDSECEALIVLGATLPDETLVRATGNTPTVVIGRTISEAHLDVVRSADLEALELLVDHLASLGHTRIAHVDGGPYPLPAERTQGYRRSMKARRLRTLVIPGGDTWESGREAGARLLRRQEDVTAVIAYNDSCAVGIMDQLHRGGLSVPDDLSVTGFDDDRVAELAQIDLTTIDPSAVHQARRAAQVAIQRAEGARMPRVVETAPAQLTVRGSTGPPAPRR